MQAAYQTAYQPAAAQAPTATHQPGPRAHVHQPAHAPAAAHQPAPEEVLAQAQYRLQVLEYNCQLLKYWMERAEAEIHAENPCMFPEDVKPIRESYTRAVSNYNTAKEALDSAMGLGKTGEAEVMVSRRQHFFTEMQKSGMDRADPALMDNFARDHKALIGEVQRQKQQVYQTLQSANLSR